MNDNEIIDNFISDEDRALKEDMGGRFVIMNYDKIHGALKKPLKDVCPEKLRKFFFHLIRLGVVAPTMNKITEKNFCILKLAYIDVLYYAMTQPKTKGWSLKEYRMNTSSTHRIPFTSFYRLNGNFLFGAVDYSEKNIKEIENTSFNEYNLCFKLIRKSGSYTSTGYAGMREDHESFREFFENPFIIRRILQSLHNVDYKTPDFPLNDLFWASIIILILSAQERVLNKIIAANKSIEALHRLAVFLKPFDWTPTSKKLLPKIYAERLVNG